MQILFSSSLTAIDFSFKNPNNFPNAPDRCPFKNCLTPIKLKAHGYYNRYFISKYFTGFIWIRRYICPICGKTVSMLPAFCLPRFQYSGVDILDMLYEHYHSGISLNKLIEKTRTKVPTIDRRHLNFYRKRIIRNRSIIQYGLNLISPEFILEGNTPENQQWIKTFLEKVQLVHPHVFLLDFSNSIGKSFMTS